MKLSKSITGLVSSIALLGVLVSCGEKTQGQSSSSKTVGEKPSTVTISFWHTFGKNTQDHLSRVIEEFHDLVLEHDGVNVNIETSYKGSYDDIQNNILMGFASGSYPNITVAYPDNVANYIYNSPKGREVLINLDQWMSSPEVGFGTQEWLGDKSGSITYGKDDFVEAFIEESSMYQQEGSYSLPFMKSSEVMFYNKQAFYTACKMYQPEGVNVDSTDAMDEWISDINWNDFMAFGEYIRDHKQDILTSLEYPIYYDSDSNLFITKLMQTTSPTPQSGITGSARSRSSPARTAPRPRPLSKAWPMPMRMASSPPRPLRALMAPTPSPSRRPSSPSAPAAAPDTTSQPPKPSPSASARSHMRTATRST